MYKPSLVVGICLMIGGISTGSTAADAGVVFMKTIGKHLYHEKVPVDATHNYYTSIEGPSWENNYCCWRTYLDQDNRNCVDITGKKRYEPTLAHYDEPNADVHAIHNWGTDVLVVGSTLGLGAFRIQYGDQTWRNPQLGIDIDSLVVDLIDTTYDSPKFQIAYWGWRITSSAKINAFWTLETKKEMRSTMAELKIDGPLNNNTKVIIGMTKNSGVRYIEDKENHNIITLGVQTEVNDSLMMALHADEKYFDSFTSNSAHYAIALKLDENQTAKWAFTQSWVQEPQPVFRKNGWQDELFSDLPPATGTAFEKSKFNVSDDNGSFISQSYPHECIVFDLAGRAVSSAHSLRHQNAGLQRMPKGYYLFRDMNNKQRVYNMPIVNTGN